MNPILVQTDPILVQLNPILVHLNPILVQMNPILVLEPDLGSFEPDIGSNDSILGHEPDFGSFEPDLGSFEPDLGSNNPILVPEPDFGSFEPDLGSKTQLWFKCNPILLQKDPTCVHNKKVTNKICVTFMHIRVTRITKLINFITDHIIIVNRTILLITGCYTLYLLVEALFLTRDFTKATRIGLLTKNDFLAILYNF